MELLDYAAKDVYASQLLFEKLMELVPLEKVNFKIPGRTCIRLLIQAGGETAAYGHIIHSQPATLGNI